MAIEIPPLVPDRMPHPDWGPGTAPDRFQLPASRLLEVLGESRLPAALQQSVQELASAGAPVDLLLSPDRSVLQLLVDGRRLSLTGAARDAILQFLGDEAHGAGESNAATGDAGAQSAASYGAGMRAFADVETAARIASVGAQIEESLAQDPAARGVDAPAMLEDGPLQQPAAIFTQPLISRPGLEDVSHNLSQAVESSGLFLEAHVAQWLRGERSLRQIDSEVQSLAVDIGPAVGTDRRGAQQLEAAQRQSIVLAGPAWNGQPVHVEIERDRERHREASNLGDATGMFTATVRMSLPQLGELRARIRVMDTTVGVQIETSFAGALAEGAPDLASALSARGLNLVQLAVSETGSGTMQGTL